MNPQAEQRWRRLFRLECRWDGLLESAAAVALFGTVAGFCGAWSWFLDLFAHFRVQYTLILLVAALVALLQHRRRFLLLYLAFASLNLAVIAPLWRGRAPAADSRECLRVMLANVNAANRDPSRLIRALGEYSPDFLVVEELTPAWAGIMTNLAGAYPFSVVQARDDCFGIGVYSRVPFIHAESFDSGPAGVPSVRAALVTHLGKCVLFATHPVPPRGAERSRWRNEHLRELEPQVTRTDWPVMLIGDLNLTPWSAHFRRLLRQTGLRNSMQGFGVQASWPAHIFPLRIPIDHALHSSSIEIVRRMIGPDIGSDHFPLIVDFRPPPP